MHAAVADTIELHIGLRTRERTKVPEGTQVPRVLKEVDTEDRVGRDDITSTREGSSARKEAGIERHC
jgi:hypothetical protein